jgi:hypothetical protein
MNRLLFELAVWVLFQGRYDPTIACTAGSRTFVEARPDRQSTWLDCLPSSVAGESVEDRPQFGWSVAAGGKEGYLLKKRIMIRDNCRVVGRSGPVKVNAFLLCEFRHGGSVERCQAICFPGYRFDENGNLVLSASGATLLPSSVNFFDTDPEIGESISLISRQQSGDRADIGCFSSWIIDGTDPARSSLVVGCHIDINWPLWFSYRENWEFPGVWAHLKPSIGVAAVPWP